MRVFAKDADGEALNLSVNTDNKPVPEALEGKDFDQSNWVEIVLPDSLADIVLNDKSLLSQTIVGKLVDKKNPKIEVAAFPMPGNSQEEYAPNSYIAANFMTAANPEYFLVTPQPNEYCLVTGVYYRGEENGKHVFDLEKGENAKNDLIGAFAINLDNYEGEDTISFVENGKYDLVGIAKSIVETREGTPVSDMLELSLISYTPIDEPVVVVVGDLNDDGYVDVSDVNICINIILNRINDEALEQLADLDGNGDVDVSDVNAIINIILGRR